MMKKILEALHLRESAYEESASERAERTIRSYGKQLQRHNLTPEQIYDFGLINLLLENPIPAVAAFQTLYSEDDYREKATVLSILADTLLQEQGIIGVVLESITKTSREEDMAIALEQVIGRSLRLKKLGQMSDREIRIVDDVITHLMDVGLIKPNFAVYGSQHPNPLYDKYLELLR